VRQTASLLWRLEGRGHSIVDGQRFDWKEFDTLRCRADRGSSTQRLGQDPVFLFVASDEPTLKKLVCTKKWGRTKSTRSSRLG